MATYWSRYFLGTTRRPTKARRHAGTEDESFDLRHSQSDIPVVEATRRQDNGPPETVETVLDRPLAVGVTTRFTFNTGGTPNTVEYTLVQSGACCQTDGACTDSNDADCPAASGIFISDAQCGASTAFCDPNGSCADVDSVCCSASTHRSQTVTARIMCEQRDSLH